MKILKIRFKNINSFYRKLYTIDFTERPLSDTSLFLISGPTGAGKSTLLDVITLALYNEIPRFGRGVTKTEIDKLGSIVNSKAAEEPRCEAYAEVEFEVKSGRYRSVWSIAKNRNGNWNNYQMEISRLPEETLLEIKNLPDYPKKNAELIGLNYEQFVKSIILAQGSFAEFLKADKNTRTKLLEDLTGTYIYRRLGEGAYERSKESGNRIKLKESEQKGVVFKSPEEIEGLILSKTEKENLRIQAEQDVERWDREKKLASDIAELEKTSVRLKSEKEKLQKELENFEKGKVKLTGHDLVSPFVAPMTRFSEIQKQFARTSEEILTKKQQSGRIATKKAALLARGQKVTCTELTEENLIPEINRFEIRVLEIESEINSRKAQIKPISESLRTEINSSGYSWTQRLPLSDYAMGAAVLGQMKEELTMLLSVYPDDFNASEKLKHLDVQFETLSDLKTLVAERERLGMEGKKAKTELEANALLEKKGAPESETIRKEVLQLKQVIEKNTDELVKETTRQSLESHRQNLREGEACPLCGSTHHPFLHTYLTRVNGLGEKIQNLKEELVVLEKKEKQKLLEVEGARKKVAELTAQLSVMRADYRLADNRIKEIAGRTGLVIEGTSEDIRNKLKSVQDEKAIIDKWLSNREQIKLADRLSESFRLLIAAGDDLKQLEEEKRKVYGGDDIRKEVKELLSEWEQVKNSGTENYRQLQQLEVQSDGLKTDLEKLKSELEAGLVAKGLSSINEAQQLLLTQEEYTRLKMEEERLKDWSQSVDVQQRENSRVLAEKLKMRAFPEISLEELTRKSEEVKSVFRRLLEDIAGIQNTLQVEAENRKRFEKIQKELDDLKKEHLKWDMLSRYIGDATGNKFSAFAQSLTLSNLIGLANARLSRLSDRYMLDKPGNEADGLYVLDTYYGNQSRAVSTLSGGETFTVSLALALALSDLASRNVRIESLFIDEGFGTLDTETLESAVSILERMQDESRKTVGVISHRQEMKERIPVQIQVEKAMDGTSTIKITG